MFEHVIPLDSNMHYGKTEHLVWLHANSNAAENNSRTTRMTDIRLLPSFIGNNT